MYNLRNNKHHNTYLQNAWNKYGESSFEFSVIRECNSVDELNNLEKALIKENKAYCLENGYNIDLGGRNHEGRIPWNKGVTGKQKAWNKGKSGVSEATSQKMSTAKIGKKPWISGKKHSKESIRKMSINKGMRIFNVYKDGEFIGEWLSIAQCGRDLGIKNYRNIGYVLKGQRKSCDGYVFKYKE